MEIGVDRIVGLSREKLREMLKIFQTGNARCWLDPADPMKVYVELMFFEVCEYLIFELESDKGLFFLFSFEISDIGLIHGHIPRVKFHVAGSSDSIATTKSEAIIFLISKIKESIARELKPAEIEYAEEELRRVLMK